MPVGTHSFSFSDFSWASAVGPGKTILAEISKVTATGGPPVHDLFARDLAALAGMRRAAAGDGTNWLEGVDKVNGYPTRYVVVGDTFLTLGITPGDDATAVLAEGVTGSPASIGFLYLVLLTGANSDAPQITQLMSSTLTYQGDPIQAFATADGTRDLIKGLVNKAVGFVADMFELAWEVGGTADLGAAAAAAGNAAEDAATAASGRTTFLGPGGATVETDVWMTTGEAVSMGLQVVAVLALLSLELLAKQMTGYVRVYNATNEALDVSLAWLDADDRYAGPTGTEFVTLAPIGPVWTPPWIIGDQAVSYAGWMFANTDKLARVAYVLRIAPTQTFPGADVMIDIPNHSDNSLAVEIGAGQDYQGFWEANHGKNTALCATSANTPASPYRVRIATNQVSGTSPAPADGRLGYQYQHVVLIEPVT